MCTLKFDYNGADTNVENDLWPFPPSNISDKEKANFEEITNLKYKDYCTRINEAGGRIIVGYTKDGKKTMNHVLVCPEDLFREIHEHLDLT